MESTKLAIREMVINNELIKYANACRIPHRHDIEIPFDFNLVWEYFRNHAYKKEIFTSRNVYVLFRTSDKNP